MHLTNFHFYNPKNYLYSKPVKGLRGCEVGCGFAFNGQEKDDEVFGEGNSANFKYRMEDTRLGRFFSVDPITSDYPELTPYQVASLSPVWMKELEGLEGIPYTDPMQAILYELGQGLIGLADMFDNIFTSGEETIITTPVSIKSKGSFTIENGIEVKTTSETKYSTGGTLRTLRNVGKPISLDALPSSTSTQTNTTTSGYKQVKYKKNNVTVIVKVTANQTETKVEEAGEVNVKVKKVPVTLKASATQSTNGSNQVKVEAKSNTPDNKVKASVTYKKDVKKSDVKVSVGAETEINKSKVSTEQYIKIKTGG